MDIEFEREMGERDAKMAKTDVSSVFIQDLTFKLEYLIIMESITVSFINDFLNPNLNFVVIRTLTRQLTF